VNRVRTIAALAALVIILAACGPTASSGSGEPSSQASIAESPASQAPAETPANGNGGSELDAILPHEVDGIAIEYQFDSGAAAMGSEGVPPEAQAIFDRLGADVSDVSTAFGFAVDSADPANPRIITIVAFRVAGADEGQLRQEFRASMEQEGNVFTEDNVGGKNVLAYRPEGAEEDSYLYVKSDIVFLAGAQPVELAVEVLSALP
jgi:hypothetical protein